MNGRQISFGYFLILAFFGIAQGDRNHKREELPTFLEPLQNATVAVGRDASLSCIVDNLGPHKVAWVHLDRQMIIAIHKQVVARHPRFFVTHDSHMTWTIHVTQVTQEDRGYWMCQVNTTPMISQKGYLQVVVPPNILDNSSSPSSLIVMERHNLTLRCIGDGFPSPHIRWRREDGKKIVTKNDREARHHEGEDLILISVSRFHSGAYLCIASNGVPPSVSKRITVQVQFPPQMNVPNQLLAASVSDDVTMVCDVDASPTPITLWNFNGQMINETPRVKLLVTSVGFKHKMSLTLRNLQEQDFGEYICTARNSISEANGSIKLNNIPRVTMSPKQRARDHYIQLNRPTLDQDFGSSQKQTLSNSIDLFKPSLIDDQNTIKWKQKQTIDLTILPPHIPAPSSVDPFHSDVIITINFCLVNFILFVKYF